MPDIANSALLEKLTEEIEIKEEELSDDALDSVSGGRGSADGGMIILGGSQ